MYSQVGGMDCIVINYAEERCDANLPEKST